MFGSTSTLLRIFSVGSKLSPNIDLSRLIPEAERLAYQQATPAGSAHDWQHILRVRSLALQIASCEGANPSIVELSALLHDVYDHKTTGTFEAAYSEVHSWVRERGVSEDLAGLIADIVHGVSYRGSGVADLPLPLEGRCVRDADRLDAIGAIGVARAVAHGAVRGQTLLDANVWPVFHAQSSDYAAGSASTVNHFFEKLLHVAGRLETETARELAIGRHAFMIAFMQELLDEWSAFERVDQWNLMVTEWVQGPVPVTRFPPESTHS